MISEIVRSAIAAIWLSYDPDTMRRGFDILRDASAAGDADAMCFHGSLLPRRAVCVERWRLS